MISFDEVTVTYDGADCPTLRDVSLEIPDGDLCLVMGPTGSGKSTVLKTITGRVSGRTGAMVRGTVNVDGRSALVAEDLADVVGYVGQDPTAGFVTDVVEDELTVRLASTGASPGTRRKRVEETLDLLDLAGVRRRSLASLSGGQRQRVAIGSVLTSHPRIFVLDEPTSALDPQSAEEVLAVLQRLVHDLGLSVVLAEHRLERVVQYADRVVLVPGDGAALVLGGPGEVMRSSPVAPPVVELGRVAGWGAPLPLSVRDARRRATSIRALLENIQPARRPTDTPGATLVSTKRLVVSYGPIPAVRGVSLRVAGGEIVAVMGRNGAGKSSLLTALAGQVAARGRIDVGGLDPRNTDRSTSARVVGLVPQDPSELLYGATVADVCGRLGDEAGSGTAAVLFGELAGDVPPTRQVADLSEGQRLSLALSVVLASAPQVLLLDEPTRGLDYSAKRRLATLLRTMAGDGHTVVLATHDVELVAEVATRVVVMADGEVVADGPTAEVVVSSPAFAPQVAKILAPLGYLTVTDVAAALPSSVTS